MLPLHIFRLNSDGATTKGGIIAGFVPNYVWKESTKTIYFINDLVIKCRSHIYVKSHCYKNIQEL